MTQDADNVIVSSLVLCHRCHRQHDCFACTARWASSKLKGYAFWFAFARIKLSGSLKALGNGGLRANSDGLARGFLMEKSGAMLFRRRIRGAS
jgi:hypothetical protein